MTDEQFQAIMDRLDEIEKNMTLNFNTVESHLLRVADVLARMTGFMLEASRRQNP